MKGIGLTSKPGIEVLSAYSTSQDDIESVAATPGWQVVGAFYLPSALDVHLEMHGSVSAGGLTMRAQFFDLLLNAPVAGAYAIITSTTDIRALSGLVTLLGNRSYQIQVEVTGATGQFGSLRSVAPTV
jgi:hypothetical protein